MRTKFLILIVLLVLPIPTKAALTFGVATSDRVDCGTYAIANTAFTVWGWIRPTTITNNKRIWAHGAGNTDENLNVSTSGNLQLFVTRATSTNFTTNNTPIATTNKWYFVATTFDQNAGAGLIGHIYVGDLTTRIKEATYGTAVDGAGARTGGTGNLLIGNTASFIQAFQGQIAMMSYVSRAMTLGELTSMQFQPHVTTNQIGYWQLGFNGNGTQPDWSGNKRQGTVTGATFAPHVPLGAPFAFAGGENGNSLAFDPDLIEHMIALRDHIDYNLQLAYNKLKPFYSL